MVFGRKKESVPTDQVTSTTNNVPSPEEAKETAQPPLVASEVLVCQLLMEVVGRLEDIGKKLDELIKNTK